jgi:hypothetical protein
MSRKQFFQSLLFAAGGVILGLVVANSKVNFTPRAEAVSYTHLTLPTN